MHLLTHCNDMAQLGKDERLLIHLFASNLEGQALRWFVNLEKDKFQTQIDLSRVFLKKYKFNLDFLPLRAKVEIMRYRPHENIKKYALRWSLAASALKNPLEEVDMTSTFLKSLSHVYQTMLLIEACNGFSSMIKTVLRIEHAILDGLVQETNQSLKVAQGEPELFSITFISPMTSTAQCHHSIQTMHTPTTPKQPPSLKRKNIELHSSSKRTKREFTPLHYPINHMLTNLVNKGHLQLLPPRQLSNPLPKTYDAKKYCTYHQGFGHLTDNCFQLKNVIQDLVD